MTREIKFRAWDVETNQFHNRNGLNIEDFGNLGFTLTNYKKGALKFNQYTGLKDKNGIEIYEGDVVSIEAIYYDGLAQYDSRLKETFRTIKNYVCKYDEGRFVFSDSLNSLSINSFFWWNQDRGFKCASGKIERSNNRFGHYRKEEFIFCELVGNIYESPELLTLTKN